MALFNRRGIAVTTDGPISLTRPRSAAAEAYRTLLASVRFSSLEQPVRSILFTSPGPLEGKSTTLANLAVIAAQAGSRVLAVDCDLRRPSLHEAFGVSNTVGLTSLLLEDRTPESCIQPGPIPGLGILTSGPLSPNSADLLLSRRVDGVFEALTELADLVMLDSPPAAGLADASLLAPRVDAVVLVIDATRTQRDDARRAKEQLERAGARLLGVVVNRAPGAPSHYRYET